MIYMKAFADFRERKKTYDYAVVAFCGLDVELILQQKACRGH